MATVYSLFFGVFLAVICSFAGFAVSFLEEPVVVSAGNRSRVIAIAAAEIGVREATGKNDGPRVEEYLRYTHLGSGHEWCAAFVSWCYGQAGFPQPRNPWSPALFPNARVYWKHGGFVKSGKNRIEVADVFGIYAVAASRINHVGLVRDIAGEYVVSIEGNSSNRVEVRRRHVRTIYAISDWFDGFTY